MIKISTVRTAIKTILDTLTSTNPAATTKPFAYCYNIHKLSVDGYPAISFEIDTDDGIIYTDQENESTYTWKVVIRQLISKDDVGRATAMNTIIGAYEVFKETFEKEWSLNGIVVYSKPPRMSLSTVETEGGTELLMTINLETIVINDVGN